MKILLGLTLATLLWSNFAAASVVSIGNEGAIDDEINGKLVTVLESAMRAHPELGVVVRRQAGAKNISLSLSEVKNGQTVTYRLACNVYGGGSSCGFMKQDEN